MLVYGGETQRKTDSDAGTIRADRLGPFRPIDDYCGDRPNCLGDLVADQSRQPLPPWRTFASVEVNLNSELSESM
jgi:hypothetical protein